MITVGATQFSVHMYAQLYLTLGSLLLQWVRLAKDIPEACQSVKTTENLLSDFQLVHDNTHLLLPQVPAETQTHQS
jgi:hypothetical protein